MVDRRLQWPRGKVLGGSSAINGLVAIRGHRDDYNGWKAMGCTGWGWDDVLPYFLRLEDFESGASELHNVGGPLPLSIARGRHFLCDKYADAAAEVLGLSRNYDFNGPSQDGAGYHHVNVSRGLIPVRVSAASAYLKDARRRPNLKIVTGATALRITFDGRRATGIVYKQGHNTCCATARRQVILSAGSVFSPHLLQLSGVGSPNHLRPLGIELVQARSAVGENLQDHLQTLSVYRVNVRTVNDKARHIVRKLITAFEGMIMRTGPYYGVTNFGMFVRTDRNLTRPDAQFHVHPASGSFKTPDRFSGLTVSAYQLRPESRGRILAVSADPLLAPAIHANYLSTPSDQRIAIAILRISRKFSESSAIAPFIVEERKPGRELQTNDELLDYARHTGETTYHPVGTCRMGGDDASVVDPRLRVRGLDGLYIADASIMPTLTSGNTHLPSVMIGEKAADIVAEDERNRPTVTIRSEVGSGASSVSLKAQRNSRMGSEMGLQGRHNVAWHCYLGNMIARRRLQRFWEVGLRLCTTGLGYHNYAPQLNGEDRFLRHWLTGSSCNLTIMDVGANEGEFTDIALEQPLARIHLFEPNPVTFARLQRKFAGNERTALVNAALGDVPASLELFDWAGCDGSGEATFLREVLGETAAVTSFKVPVITLDGYCSKHGIEVIDYLKIDVEGFEKNVFGGARRLIEAKRIRVIQFEMNMHAVVSGFSLYAAVQALPGYTIYRILPRELVEVAGPNVRYRPGHDLFRHHNLVASIYPLV